MSFPIAFCLIPGINFKCFKLMERTQVTIKNKTFFNMSWFVVFWGVFQIIKIIVGSDMVTFQK